MSFGPSLALSALLNLALFACLRPVEVTTPAARPRFVLHRLQRLATPPATAPRLDPTRTEQPTTTPAPRPRPRAEEGGGRRAPAPLVATRRNVGPPGGAPRTRPGGGDGTQAVPVRPNAGGGDPLEATPREAGLEPAMRLPGLGPAPSPLLMARAIPIDDGPPLIMTASGDRGGSGLAPMLGRDPLPGIAGSGDNPRELAPATTSGFRAPPAPTTPGPRLREKAGPGLPELGDAPTVITGSSVSPGGLSGGGGGTARLPGLGGGGPLLDPTRLADATRTGGGGSGLATAGDQPGAVAVGPGSGGTGGGGNGLATVGRGGADTPAVATGGSLVRQPGFGDGPRVVRPGDRAPGPGGAPAAAPAPTPARGPIGAGGDGPGNGNRPGGDGGGDGGGQPRVAASNRSGGGERSCTGVVLDTLALRWHHLPGSYDLHVGSVDGPRLATVSVIRFPSVAAARASDRLARDGRREIVVLRPLAIEYIAAEGEGARQRVVISSGDAAKLRASGMLQERDRIVTVYRGNY